MKVLRAGHLVFLAVLVEGGMAVTAFFLAEVLRLPLLLDAQVRPVDLLWGLAAAVPWLCLFRVMLGTRLPGLARIREVLEAHLLPLVAPARVAELFFVALLAGLGEEFLFRGVLQASLAPRLGTAGALVAASLLFGLCHPLTPLYFVLASLIGAYLGGLWLLTGSLVAPIVCHAAYDFAALVLFVKFARDEGREKKRQTDDTPPTIVT